MDLSPIQVLGNTAQLTGPSSTLLGGCQVRVGPNPCAALSSHYMFNRLTSAAAAEYQTLLRWV